MARNDDLRVDEVAAAFSEVKRRLVRPLSWLIFRDLVHVFVELDAPGA